MAFSKLKQFEVTKDMSYEHTLHGIRMADAEGNEHVPVLIGRPATQANKPFARAQLQRSNKRLKAASVGGATLEHLDAMRQDDRELYPQFVLTGWHHVYNDDGSPCDFNRNSCGDFLNALPNHIFDDVRVGFGSDHNFVTADNGLADKEDVGND